MDSSITSASLTRPADGAPASTAAAAAPLTSSRHVIEAVVLVLGLVMIVFGSTSGLIGESVLVGVAVVVLPLSLRALVTDRPPSRAGGLGLALSATVLVNALATWPL